jgi:capsular polysaccharide transport system permease protein
MHGVIRPSGLSESEADLSAMDRLIQRCWPYRFVLSLVVLPTLLVASYYYLIASDQYESRADFVVRRADAGGMSGQGLGQVFGFSLGTSQTQAEAYIVEEYLLSHDAVARLRAEDQLVERFRRPGVDLISRLWYEIPEPETLLTYFRKRVFLKQDPDTGITHLRVHAFSPKDSHEIARKLLVMGEQRINELNERTYRDQVASSKRELADAEAAMTDLQIRLNGFRRDQNDIDPEGSGKAQITLVSTLTANLVAARSRLSAMDSVVSRRSPQYLALAAQVRALEGQIERQSARLTGQGKTIASSLGSYEDLVIRREFAAKRYTAAAAAYQQAKAEALKQQLYLTRIVDANMPVKSEFPESGRIVLTTFFSLLIAYGIGWLMVAGVKEHSI